MATDVQMSCLRPSVLCWFSEKSADNFWRIFPRQADVCATGRKIWMLPKDYPKVYWQGLCDQREQCSSRCEYFDWHHVFRTQIRRYGLQGCHQRDYSSNQVCYTWNRVRIQGRRGWIIANGTSVQTIICDGKKSIVNTFANIPVQICQSHQVKTITFYLTRKSKLEASIALRKPALKLTVSTKFDFQSSLERWYEEWKDILNERTGWAFFGFEGQTEKP